MDKSEALPAIEMRFTDPADVEKYGEDWYVYDESDLILRSARELMLIEHGLGMGLFDVMNGVRARSVLGDTAAAWIAVREVSPKKAGAFNDFNPLTMLIEWRSAVQGKAEAAKAKEEVTQAPPDSAPTAETSDPTDLVTLPTLPLAE
jgi:hypothetical protein